MQLPEAGKPLVKFRHCGKSIYSFSVPQCCPLCHQEVGSPRLEDAPISISSPFSNGHQEKCSFLLRPTQGTFLREYDGRADLHVGIASTAGHAGWELPTRVRVGTSLRDGADGCFQGTREYLGDQLDTGYCLCFRGLVYNYTERGVQRDQAGWEQSVSVPLLPPGMFGLMDQWDKYLEDFSSGGAWLPHRYDEAQHNCYSYTLSFINRILATEGWGQLAKSDFTEKFVVPRTRQASRYITLYRALEERGFCVVPGPEPEPAALQGHALC